MRQKRLGDILIASGALTQAQLDEALKNKKPGERIGEALINQGYITQQDVINSLQQQLGIDYIDLTKTSIDPSMSKYIPKQLAKETSIVPVRESNGNLFLAMADPLNFMALEQARNTSKRNVIPMIAKKEAVDHAINVLYENVSATEAMAQMRAEAGFSPDQIDTAEETPAAEEGPTIRLVNSIFDRALDENCSDIHIEPVGDHMDIRMRIDGRLHKTLEIPHDLIDPVISRVKVMSRMNIVEKRIPQDGRIDYQDRDGAPVDMRVNTLPTIYGEKIVVRILGRNKQMLTRKGIGMIFDEDNEKLDRLMANTSGVIMIVGPTGSGKSSTMFTLLQELISESVNVVTLEDPVEYNIPGATQVQINEKVGLTFASGLRAILRQDPDIICVGEIRDGETAEIAMRAAITGHLVITTIHTEDAVSAIDRLKDMGVEPYLISAGLRGIISQRLVRRVCQHCRQEYTPDPRMVALSGINAYPGRKYYHGVGCDQCFHTGYRGRIGAFEILPMNDELRRCITSNVDNQTFRETAQKSAHYTTMLQHADKLAEEGITTVEEICRTIMVTD
ncbi:MAG: Flp pilus assembly complex ATPase component TadA [Lachnospiraceae bacterium]|jgi:type IV pilus assembly protein PilB|nr:Flp pilus assembly complex ATPase component TadA [Lachnospiraceae bacterium]MCH4029239.1 Flp pilus assembly complex ATPase component TadA [Lachnospiraceae bacterium]MCH4067909.1 Flp pilus assembly complex ATPase component TadA [Lachnospiraceae bacterium]MCH4113934.1 Flp pilus assembly complex ATPase component TadA [Lachnospiraceae bacterium]MCI1353827.1 Flp pilus assembly complex ATPase component TadA [Lachnospiraceae bacterium]